RLYLDGIFYLLWIKIKKWVRITTSSTVLSDQFFNLNVPINRSVSIHDFLINWAMKKVIDISLFCFLTLIIAGPSIAPEMTVKGQVLSREEGTPIPGVNIKVV